MAVFEPEQDTQGLAADAHRVLLAGPIDGLAYPALCPNCGAPAAEPVTVTKVFRFQHRSGRDNGGGWRYRIAEARPLFCADCAARHRTEHQPATAADRVKSVVFSEPAIPGVISALLALYLFREMGPDFLRDPAGNWPLMAFAGAIALIALLSFRGAWTSRAHARIPVLTPTARAFDFGDDGASPFEITMRTYAIRNAASAEEFARLNAERHAALTGPAAKARVNRRFWITAAVFVAIALFAWWIGRATP